MKLFKLFALTALLALLLVPMAVYAQEQTPERGVVEFGIRGVTGDVYGRTTPGSVPFSNGFRPNLLNSGLNTYNDYRNAFYVPKVDFHLDNFLGTDSYLKVQAANNGFAFEGGGSLSRDLSALITVGQYGHYKLQFRFDETPHLFSGTTRTLFSGGNGTWNINPALQSSLFATICGSVTATGACKTPGTVGAIATAMNNAVAGSLVSGVAGTQYMTQQESRKTIGGSFGWNITPDVNVSALFSREQQVGTRPIGFVMGNSSTGFVAEAPETIDYYTSTVNVSTEFGKKHWDALIGYQGSFFQNNVPSMLVANPFSNVYNQVTSTMSSTVGPATGRMDLYPDNSYHQVITEGTVQLGKHIVLMANITPGWLSQNASFQPLTTNTYLTQTPPAGYPAFLPKSSLNGQVDTLTMNYTAVVKATKNFKVVAKYFHYAYEDNTPEILVRPTVADTSYLISSSFHGSTAGCFDPVVGPSSENVTNAAYTYYCPNDSSSFTNRLFDVGGTWFFTKKNSVKFGYQHGWTDRTHRQVEENTEDSFYGAVDLHPRKDLTLRISGRHQNRMPQGGVNAYELDTGNVFARMPDQSTRLRNRADVSLQWDATQRLSLNAFWGTLQDNFNIKSSVNSLVPVGDATTSAVLIAGTKPTPIYGPYYAYGLLNSIGRNYGVGANFAATSNVVLFAEYAREKNTGVILQGRGLNTSTCGAAGSSCDPINDLLTANKDVVNSYYGGMDVTTKKVDFSMYYSLSAVQSFVAADGVNCQIGNGWTSGTSYCDTHFTNWSMDAAATPAVSFGYPTTINRVHEVGVITRFKLTQNFIPKIQYTFRQFDNNDWQTGIVNPYSFVGASIDPTAQSTINKMLFLGADNPSYRTHIFTATLEYHF